MDLYECKSISKPMEAVVGLLTTKQIVLKELVLSMWETNVSTEEVIEVYEALRYCQQEL